MKYERREKFRCPICGVEPNEACRNSVTQKPRDRRHATRPGGPPEPESVIPNA